MKVLTFAVIFLGSLFLFSCSDNADPVSEEQIIDPRSGGYSMDGIVLEFEDSCSYNFVMSFLSNYDSVRIGSSHLGNTYHLYAVSGDINYWTSYFANDSTIDDIMINVISDSLMVQINTTGMETKEDEIAKYSGIENLRIKQIEEYPKHVYLNVPYDSEEYWKSFFEKFAFITRAYIIYVVED